MTGSDTVALVLSLILTASPAIAQDTADVRYGRRLLDETHGILGPAVADPVMRYAGNNLACSSCHLDAGTRPGMLSLAKSFGKYPREMARSGRIVTLADRINGCMTRSLNGRPLPEDGAEMTAIVAYLEEIGRDTAVRAGPEPGQIAELDRAADPARGERLYARQCRGCHGADGLGVLNGRPGDSEGYLHPPLWGDDSFNDGAGMARLIEAANFIHAKMPYHTAADAPELPAENSWDIAAYMLSQPRPELQGLEADYPDVLEKPVDTAYPPFVPGFSAEQHKYGPFQPIRDRIEELTAADEKP